MSLFSILFGICISRYVDRKTYIDDLAALKRWLMIESLHAAATISSK